MRALIDQRMLAHLDLKHYLRRAETHRRESNRSRLAPPADRQREIRAGVTMLGRTWSARSPNHGRELAAEQNPNVTALMPASHSSPVAYPALACLISSHQSTRDNVPGAWGSSLPPAHRAFLRGICPRRRGRSAPNFATNSSRFTAWIFQVTGTLTIANSVKMILLGARATNIVWVVADAITAGTNSHLEGVFLGKTGIPLQSGATANSRLRAQTLVALQKAIVTMVCLPWTPPICNNCH
ncbi:hypothetical protein DFH09DRAFT_1461906 [Mycena vulgaris]|nr:hypothetical protein DFH09DRAFT_1461906 [Mycena vulgaris]